MTPKPKRSDPGYMKWYTRKNKKRLALAAKARYMANREYFMAKSRERYRANPEAARKAKAKWAAAHPRKMRRYRDKWYANNYHSMTPNKWRTPEKGRARGAVAYAILKGDIKRPSTCSECGKRKKVEAHHPDYSKPLSVVWLCISCHRRVGNAPKIAG